MSEEMEVEKEYVCCHCGGVVSNPISDREDDDQSCTHCMLSGIDFERCYRKAVEP